MALSAELAMSVAQIAVDATASDRVAGVVGVGQGETLECAEVSLDQVQSGGVVRNKAIGSLGLTTNCAAVA